MSLLRKTLERVLNMSEDICCLCHGGSEFINIEDEIYIGSKEEEYMSLAFILTSLMGTEPQILDYIKTFKNICKACTQLALNSYSFIKTSKENYTLLSNSIVSLLNSVNHVADDIFDYSSLFISMSTDDFSTNQFYDTTIENCIQSHTKVEKGLEDRLRDTMKTERQICNCNCEVPIESYSISQSVQCKECFKVEANEKHLLTSHMNKNYKCNDCMKTFSSLSKLETHKSKRHSLYVCSECGKIYKNKQSFESHEMSHYMKLVCQDCGRVYKSKATFNKHVELNICGRETRASQADAKFTCDYCNKKYSQKVSLRVHIQYEHGNYKYHVCKICNKKFWAQSRLKAHMVKHTKEKNFQCKLCNGKFVTKEALIYHTRLHTGEKPYKCSHCNVRFLSASRRSVHVKRHHTNATIECDVCGSKFNSINYLHKHKRGHYNKTTNELRPNKLNNATQKVSAKELIELTHDLKNIESQKYQRGDVCETDIYLELKNDVDNNYIFEL